MRDLVILMEKPSGGAGRGGGASSGAVAGAPGSGAQSSAPAGSVAAQVDSVVNSLPTADRIQLADIQDRINGSWEEAGRELRNLQLQGRIVLMPMDDPQEVTARDRRAAISVGGDDRMVIYRVR